MDGKQLQSQYKDHLSDFQNWDQRAHAQEYILYPKNMGYHLCIDETALSKGDLYTILINRDKRGRKGSIIAVIQGTKTDDIIAVLTKMPQELRNHQGGAGLPDIGQLFPDSDIAFKGADSLALLKQVGGLLAEKEFLIINIDSVIAAQAPKLSPYKEEMRLNIARALEIEPERVGVKATTTERLGFTGRQEGIAATACALIIKKDK